ncbi:hypothetical protein HanPI659440_Chr01g0014041 [Helianthus annuus]|nr:hypothetical protein HanPI659440_Chr01g0014041 [Helianthus annuus]
MKSSLVRLALAKNVDRSKLRIAVVRNEIEGSCGNGLKQERQTGQKEARERTQKGCTGHGGSSRNKDRGPSHMKDCTGLSKDDFGLPKTQVHKVCPEESILGMILWAGSR